MHAPSPSTASRPPDPRVWAATLAMGTAAFLEWAVQPAMAAAARPADGEFAVLHGLRSTGALGGQAGGLRLHWDSAIPGLPGSARLDATWALAQGRGELRATMPPAPGSLEAFDATTQAVALAAAAPGSAVGWRLEAPRLTWRRAWIDAPELKLRLGVTARLRDSAWVAGPGPVFSSRPDGGFVPLLHASLEQRLGDRFSLLADVDALVPGGAPMFDAGVRLRYDFSQAWAGTMAYRLLDSAPAGREAGTILRRQSLSLGVQYRW